MCCPCPNKVKKAKVMSDDKKMNKEKILQKKRLLQLIKCGCLTGDIVV